jgi:N-acetylmuramoyl-L-alanine amidase
MLSVKDKYIDRVSISENSEGVGMTFLLKGEAKFWEAYDGPGSVFVFEAGKEKITVPAYSPAPSAPPDAQPAQGQIKPSVLDGGDNILGDDFFSNYVPPVTAAVAAAQPKTEQAKPSQAPAIKAIPAPTVRIDTTKPGKKIRKARILIDPGHGGKDPGAVRKGSAREKELNLIVAKYLYELLKKDKDFEVRLTRDDDKFVTLGGRAKMANDFKADIFISIHANAAKRVSANGFEVYFRSDKASSAEAAETAALENEALQYEGQSPAGVTFADLLLKSLATNENMNESSKIASHIRTAATKNSSNIGIKVYQNSCIKQANFYVLRGVEAPSVLVEMGYVSNANDRKRLNNRASRAKIAESIRDGVVSYAKAEGWK